jgi:Spy/CpxP family protein refolding chaperone
MKKRTTVLSGVLALGLLGMGIVGVSNANPGGHGHGEGRYMKHAHHDAFGGAALKRLQLSDEQRTQIREIFKRQAETGKEKAQTLHELNKELQASALSNTFDPVRAQELASQAAGIESELRVLRLSGLNEAYQVLSIEQQEKLATWQERRSEKQAQRGERKQPEAHRHP